MCTIAWPIQVRPSLQWFRPAGLSLSMAQLSVCLAEHSIHHQVGGSSPTAAAAAAAERENVIK
jgi:hypothetical protein